MDSTARSPTVAAGAFTGRLSFGTRPALLLIDIVMAYLLPDSPLAGAAFEDAFTVNVRLAAAARARDVPVIFTNVIYQPGGADGGLFFRKVPALRLFERGAPGGEFPPSLQPLPIETVVSKQYASAFFGTSLASTLHAAGVDTVIIGGFSTSGCVRASALDALQNGFAPFVVREACADRSLQPHDANLEDLALKYAEVIDESTLMGLLQAPV